MRVYCPNKERKKVIFGTQFYDPRVSQIHKIMHKIMHKIRPKFLNLYASIYSAFIRAGLLYPD